MANGRGSQRRESDVCSGEGGSSEEGAAVGQLLPNLVKAAADLLQCRGTRFSADAHGLKGKQGVRRVGWGEEEGTSASERAGRARIAERAFHTWPHLIP